MVYNFSEDIDYHKQIKNKLIPLSSCNTTSLFMALKQAGIDSPFPEDENAVDYFTSFFRQPEAYKKTKELAPWAFDKRTGEVLYHPNEVHAVLEWGINLLLKKEVDRFSTKYPLQTIINHLLSGGGVVLTGIFHWKGKPIGHMTSMAGFITDETDIKTTDHITHYIIDDPLGNPDTDYTDSNGNNFIMTKETFISTFNPGNNEDIKWAHLVKDWSKP